MEIFGSDLFTCINDLFSLRPGILNNLVPVNLVDRVHGICISDIQQFLVLLDKIIFCQGPRSQSHSI